MKLCYVWRTLNYPTLASYDERVSIKNILLRVTGVTTVTTAVNNKLGAATLQRLRIVQYVKGAYVRTTTTLYRVLVTSTVRRIVQLFTCLIVQLFNVCYYYCNNVLLLSRTWCSCHTTKRYTSNVLCSNITIVIKSINTNKSQRATSYRVATQNRVGVKS